MTKDTVTPILKWPGGKRRVLPEIRKYMPSSYGTYFEPFFGGGAVYFDLKPATAVVADINSETINLYNQVKSNPKALIKELKESKYANTASAYASIRELDRDPVVYAVLSNIERAARIVYLNRTCFNGLYRVNSKNQFNVPFGKYNNPRILDEDNILAVSKMFNAGKTNILNEDYVTVLSQVAGDRNFVYLDPPYIPLSVTSSFASYTKDGFTLEQQKDLSTRAKQLDENGNFVLLSNSDTDLTREIYDGFHVVPIQVTRSVGANSATRVAVGEVLILGNTLAKHLNL